MYYGCIPETSHTSTTPYWHTHRDTQRHTATHRDTLTLTHTHHHKHVTDLCANLSRTHIEDAHNPVRNCRCSMNISLSYSRALESQILEATCAWGAVPRLSGRGKKHAVQRVRDSGSSQLGSEPTRRASALMISAVARGRLLCTKLIASSSVASPPSSPSPKS